MIILSLISLLASFAPTASAYEFSQYPTPVEAITCKELNYDSYHKAQRSKSNIMRANPNRTQPNFAGKYLLLKNDMLMETEWLIADCKTGKFFNKAYYGLAEFKPDSNLLLLTENEAKEKKIAEPAISYVWSGEQFIKLVPVATTVATTDATTVATTPASTTATVPATTTTVPSAPSTVAGDIMTLYSSVQKQYPAKTDENTCKKLDFSSYPQADQAKAYLQKTGTDLTRPNFAGKYLLLEHAMMFETQWFIADCATGKFFRFALPGQANFKKDSTLVILNSNDTPELMHWTGDQWMRVMDPVQKSAKKIKNTVYGEDAKAFFNALPKQDKYAKRIKFENLECVSSTPPTCTIEKGTPVPAEKAAALANLVQKWGRNSGTSAQTTYAIQAGSCSATHAPECEVELNPLKP